MIRVKQLHLENVGPFKAQDFDFSVEKGHPDIHIFTGINGTGKTTILHAIAAMFDHFEGTRGHKPYNSNQLHKRFRFFNDFGVEDVEVKSTIQGEIIRKDWNAMAFKLLIFGCGSCRNVHKEYQGHRKLLETSADEVLIEGAKFDKIIDSYESSLGPTGLFGFPLSVAAFGYSGYRLISSSDILLGNEAKFRPLHEALHFVKKSDPNFNISNWIVSRHASAAVAESSGDKTGANRIRQALDTLLRSIESLTDNEYQFSIQTNPWKVTIKYFDQEVDFDVLPDGLRSVLSWMGDLLMRMDNIPWTDKTIPVNEQHIILLLDEIEVHLHPKWQYQILPLTQKIFPNAQIFITTHSPFILNSIDNAKIYRLKTDRGEASLENVVLSETGNSYSYVYENILDTHNIFGYATTKDLKRFNELDREIAKQNYLHEAEFMDIVKRLMDEGDEVVDMISSKLLRIKRITGKDYFHGENQEKAAV